MQTRALAALIINDVIQEQITLTSALEKHQEKIQNAQDKAFVQDLCFGVFRWREQLDAFLNYLSDKPIKKKDAVLKALLWTGLYQLKYQQTPAHAAVSSTVDACKALKKTSAKSLVNALLRRFIREQEQLVAELNKQDSIKHSHPIWLYEKIKYDWPEQSEAILSANQQRPPLTLRVNHTRISSAQYSKKLTADAIAFTSETEIPTAITLEQACNIRQLPGFAEGEFSVQDKAAQLAAGLLDLQQGQRVLDACAAPGGKSAHILETETALNELLCLESDAKRAVRIEENLTRLRLKANIIINDARKPEDWWDGNGFDRILLDVPCSATGIIRRHPDIKYLRDETDIETLIQIQTEILDKIWPLLDVGGKLVYSTCSVLKCENEKQIDGFLQRHDNARLDKLKLSFGQEREHGSQILPGQNDMDGFFYARLIKT